MNRKKKINQSLKKRLKKTNAKLQKTNKPKYVSKAERAKIAAELDNTPCNQTSNNSDSSNQE